MKQGLLKKFISTACAAVMCMSGLSAITASADQTYYNNKTGTEDGYDFELWKDSGNTRMTCTGGGTFSCEWSNINNCLFRKGKKFDSTQTHQQIGDIAIDYAVDYQPNGNSYMCVYGWTRSPLIEYYIVESWGSWRPPGNAASLGTVYSDGGAYDIYKTTRENCPSIDGDTTFDQYWSVRQNKPQANGTKIEGTISVSKHFKAWESAGLKMGKMVEVALNIEGYQSSGKATVYGNKLRINEGKTDNNNNNNGDVSEPIQGTLYTGTFENGTDYWSGRGDAIAVSTSAKSYEGSKSLYISGRTKNWNGAELALDSTYFKAGTAYSFSTMVMPAETTTVQLSMQYDQSGTTNYAQIAKSNCTSGKWTKLENTSFTIPSGASNIKIYVEAPDSLCDIYVDRAICANAGYKAEGNVTNTTYPTNITSTYNEQTRKMTLSWDAVKDASAYAIAVFQSGKWKVLKSNITSNSYTATVSPGKSYKVAVGAKINGKWDTTNALKNAVIVTAKDDGSSNGGNNDPDPDPKPDTYFVDPSKPMVAISFDDGASSFKKTDSGYRIIDAIANSGFRATFFYVGEWTTSEEQVRYAYSKGMEIANHTYTHPDLTKKSSQEIRSEYDRCYNKLKNIIGAEPSKLLRLPFLSSNWQVQQALYDVPMITCSIDTKDWDNASTSQIVATIQNAANNGSLNGAIVLCHETKNTTAEAMEIVIPWLKQQGYQVVTISDMFAAKGKTLSGGQIYTKAS
ncbi:Peptidoglycan/xylan/chitin deacetylase, PgdA/CDA1 family [Ruminococcus sp. YE71]|uniref:glycoside hydrolase family 11 protein n=1 Tax=unclassified Ruminococcus TaxID=2608920 RepID=UPI00087E42F6|nr:MULTISPECIES: glycoside hydrolase family 11 protein [unclassified Ruminococcus]SDA26691.1 Peptidoglycan/xylan/chitin deacetylase, PgdA/CDA1 family [Ruminococcus sp. YE78]SFW44393.1 Peptidoglycan/xylan/chitin deacetylase, PgdA/CDA1 family [Ruminococcus sp. YE71]